MRKTGEKANLTFRFCYPSAPTRCCILSQAVQSASLRSLFCPSLLEQAWNRFPWVQSWFQGKEKRCMVLRSVNSVGGQVSRCVPRPRTTSPRALRGLRWLPCSPDEGWNHFPTASASFLWPFLIKFQSCSICNPILHAYALNIKENNHLGLLWRAFFIFFGNESVFQFID